MSYTRRATRVGSQSLPAFEEYSARIAVACDRLPHHADEHRAAATDVFMSCLPCSHRALRYRRIYPSGSQSAMELVTGCKTIPDILPSTSENQPHNAWLAQRYQARRR